MKDSLKALTRSSDKGKKKKSKAAPQEPTPLSRAGQALRGLGRLAFLWLTVPALAGLAFFAFYKAYYTENPAFELRPEDIIVRGNTTIPRDFIIQAFGLDKRQNGYTILRSEIVERLKTQMPLLKNVHMAYMPGRSLELWVEERLPIARVSEELRPLVVDDTGTLFMYPRPTEGYPMVSGFDTPDGLAPGGVLPDSLHCMLRLIAALNAPENRLPSGVRRVTLLGNDVEDGLRVFLADGRRLTLAWDDMARERKPSEGMLKRIRHLNKALREPLNEGKKHFNAMAEDAVAVSE